MPNQRRISKSRFVLFTATLIFSLGLLAHASPGTERTAQISKQPAVDRAAALSALMEGQRYMWRSMRLQTEAGRDHARGQAAKAFNQALVCDPSLAEAYTALAELALTATPPDVEEATRLSKAALEKEPNNFGANRWLARIFTIKSGLGPGKPDAINAEHAIRYWKNITRMDPRYAEGWAFLAAFAQNDTEKTAYIDDLRKWIASATPIDVQFYNSIMGPGSPLSTETAVLKLANVLVSTGDIDGAIEPISSLISDDPNNIQAIELLSRIADSADGRSVRLVVEALQQAVYASPANVELNLLLAKFYQKTGNIDSAISLLNGRASSLEKTAPDTAAIFLSGLGDLYMESDQFEKASLQFEKALQFSGFRPGASLSEDETEAAKYVLERLIQIYRLTDENRKLRSVIDRAAGVFGKDDLFAVKHLIRLHQESGDRPAGLSLTRSALEAHPSDVELIRTQASLLTDMGKVEEAVRLLSPDLTKALGGDANTAAFNRFSDLLFISHLYSRSGLGKEAVKAAKDAYEIAVGTEQKNMANLTLATAQQMSGEHDEAEKTLRTILKEEPSNPIALNNLGYFLIERGIKFDEAQDLIKRAVKLDPTNPSYLDSLGWAYFKLGKIEEADKILRKALRADPGSSTIHEHLGDILFEQGSPDKARSTWEKALRLSTDTTETERIRLKLKSKE